jgi:hypothetical protein
LAIELAQAIESEAKGIDISGSIAFICLQVKKHSRKINKLFFGRNESNPLKLEIVKEQFKVIFSDLGKKIDH